MSKCKVTRIYFNYYKTGYEEGPGCGTNVMPEDLSRFPTLPYNAVAFAMDRTENIKLKVHAEFSGPKDKTIYIRTVSPSPRLLRALREFMFVTTGVRIGEEGTSAPPERLLGDVESTAVTLDGDGNSYVSIKGDEVNKNDRDRGVVEFEIDHLNFSEKGIRASWQLWQWQYREEGNETWEVVGGLPYQGISVHRVFITKDIPHWPWTNFDESYKIVKQRFFISRPPYIGALEWACKWAEGKKTEEEIASVITEKLFDFGRFEYPLTTFQNYTSPIQNIFDCTRFIDRLNGKFGRGKNANCVDCAHMVISLANALGCKLQAGLIQNTKKENFTLNPLVLIGHHGNCNISTFKFHKIAFHLATEKSGLRLVYDACIKCNRSVYDEAMKETQMNDRVSPVRENDVHPVGIPLGKDIFSPGYFALLAKREKTPSQEGLEMLEGDDQVFSVGSIEFT